MMTQMRRITARIIHSHLFYFLLTSAQAQTTTSPAIALITSANFVGYTSADNNWSPTFCPTSSTWYETGTWGRCCPITASGANCGIWTSCSDHSIIFQSGRSTTTCNSPMSVCRTALILQNSDDKSPATYVGCGTGNWTAYRTPPQALVITITASSPATTNSPSSSTPTTSSPTSTSTSTPQPSSSKGWIAGVVLGPIALIAIAGLLWYIWILRRKQPQRQGSTEAIMQGALGGYPPSEPRQSYQQVPGYMYEQPYEQSYGQYYDPHKQAYDRATGVSLNAGAPIELSSTLVPVEVPAEPISPKNSR
ncbi:hypothetical protein AOQ84DRAFT_207656 [Glonium stellatum]|uniref:Mid2 domain-containing protein n=1 Tax=Glonium stellatum TaxID=574774 RepID=A0A8E2FDH0_9PEZI|nr:hypothetical protein AOQ84DRAFT_207656 [Glonium stellatum]